MGQQRERERDTEKNSAFDGNNLSKDNKIRIIEITRILAVVKQ